MPPRTRQVAPRQTGQAELSVSQQDTEAVQRLIDDTDWTDFWARVTESSAAEMEAYERARVKSLQTASQHVFM